MTVWLNEVTGCYLTRFKMCLEMNIEIGSFWWCVLGPVNNFQADTEGIFIRSLEDAKKM